MASLLPPFYPAQNPPRDEQGQSSLRRFAAANGLSVEGAYPYISDMSFFAFEPKAMEFWRRIAPVWYSAEEVQVLAGANTPVTNLGPLGYGAHSAHERAYLPQLDRLPALLVRALRELA